MQADKIWVTGAPQFSLDNIVYPIYDKWFFSWGNECEYEERMQNNYCISNRLMDLRNVS